MAKFVLGAIITNIAGSVGGTTLKRSPNGFIMMNKTKGTSKNRLRANPRLGQLANLFQRWNTLSNEDKDSWGSLADELQFPDKFGVWRNLKPRELYIKFNGQLLPVNEYFANAYTENGNLSEEDYSGMDIYISTQQLLIYIARLAYINWLLLQVEVFQGEPTTAPRFSRRKILGGTLVTAPGTIDMGVFLFENYPDLQAGNVVRVYTTYMALNGNRNGTTFLDVLVQA